MVSKRRRFYLMWRRLGVGLRLVLILIVVLLLSALVYFQRPMNEDAYLGSNLVVFALVNLNVALICVLVFLVGRNLARVVLDWRRGILGSKLRLRLVLAFLLLTLLPSTVLVILASGLLTRATEGWFSTPAEASVEAALDVARVHIAELEREVLESVQTEVKIIQSDQTLSSDEQLKRYLDVVRRRSHLYDIRMVRLDGSVIVESRNAAAFIDHYQPPTTSLLALERAKQRPTSNFEETESSQFVRAYSGLSWGGEDAVLVITQRLDPDLTNALGRIRTSYGEYEQLKLFKNPLKSSYLLILYMFTGLIMFAAIWMGLYIARELSVPLKRLVEGTKEIAKGNYDFRIGLVGSDEFGSLIRSFNSMTMDLKNARDAEEQSRLYIETILRHLAVGVIALDLERRVTSLNQAAARMFEIADQKRVLHQDIKDLVGENIFEELIPLLESVDKDFESKESAQEALERQFPLFVGGQERQVLCTAGWLTGPASARLGTLLIFDDITALSQAQQLAAWREAARRIAHEIKNPLTPIQLAAQRIHKLAEQEGGMPETVRTSSQAIVTHVHSIKRLADEFSRFSRMPTAEFEPSDLNELISNVLAPYAEEYTDIMFHFISDREVPKVMMDEEQIQRVVVNLLDNAIRACSDVQEPRTCKIVIRTEKTSDEQAVTLEVADTGVGIADVDKIRIFQPYFTKRPEGTGLGLAIVSSIVSEHQGAIRVYDNKPWGSRFVIELPLVHRAAAQRKILKPDTSSNAV